MTLFEIDRRIEGYFDTCAVDPETGEVIFDTEEFDALDIERGEKRKHIAMLIKNLDSDITELNEQEKVFAKRRKAKENKRAWLIGYLMRSLDGEDFECPEVSVKHKKNPEKVVWEQANEQSIIKWLKRHKLGRLVSVKSEAKINKQELKSVIRNGTEVPNVSLVSDTALTIK